MKVLKVLAALSFLTLLSACPGGGSGGIDENNPLGASGVLSLSGADTAVFGVNLDVAEVRAIAQTNILPDYAMIGSEGTTAETPDPNQIPDPNNMFLIVVNQNFPSGGYNSAISMTIRANGVDFDYICHNPAASSADCGTGLTLDIEAREASFVNVDVANTDSGEILRINGVVKW